MPTSRSRTMSIGGATYDLFVRTDHKLITHSKSENAFMLPLGEKIRVQEVIETCGGGASNTAVGLARLGCDASFCGVIGSDQWGEKLLENLRKEKVDVRAATIVEGETTSFSIILTAGSGERVILYDPGTNEHLHDANFDREAIERSDWIYLNHIQDSSCVIQNDIVAMLTDTETRLTWNPGGCQIDAGMKEEKNALLLAQTDLLLVNKEEALRFSKAKTPEEAIRIFLSLGVKNVCITDGSKGVIASDGKMLYHCPIVKDRRPVDTTGAGDAFGTGATWALLKGKDLPTALKAGTINAASVVGAIGAQHGLLTENALQDTLQSSTLAVDVSRF